MTELTYNVSPYNYSIHGRADDCFMLSHSIMDAIHQCPRWGMIRYVYKRAFNEGGRSMALEYGSFLHECMAAIRLWRVWHVQQLPKHAAFHAERLFADNNKILLTTDDFVRFLSESEPDYQGLTHFIFRFIACYDWEDNPSDKNRTQSNLEACVVKYLQQTFPMYNEQHVYIQDPNEPSTPIGIELPIDLIITSSLDPNNPIRFIGTMDGLSLLTKTDELLVEEHKTASRPDEHYRNAWRVQTQPSGYKSAVHALYNADISKVRVTVHKTKPNGKHDDLSEFIEFREPEAIGDWCKELFYTRDMIAPFIGDPCRTPRFTHSCNRYFTSCALIPFCSQNDETRQQMFAGMVQANLSPSEEALLARTEKLLQEQGHA